MKKNRFLINTMEKVVNAVKSFRKNPIDSIGIMVPVLVGLTALIGFITAYITFFVNGGYTEQIELIKTNGIDGINKAFTGGTIYIIYSGIILGIISVLLVVAFIMMMIAYFTRESKAKKIIMIVFIAFTALLGGIILLIDAIYEGKVEPVTEQGISILELLDNSNMPMIILVIAVLALLLVVSIFMLLFTAKSGWMVKHNIKAALTSFVGLPLFLLFLENIVPLFAGIIVLAVIGGLIYLIIKSVSSSAGSGGGVSSSSGESSSGHSKNSLDKSKGDDKKNDKNCVYVDLGILGGKLYKMHGLIDPDYVGYNGSGLAISYICSLDDLRKGRFHIYDKATGKEIKESDIPWRQYKKVSDP